MKFSKYQQAIFDHVKNNDSHLIVQALAGSGKTTTIAAAIAQVVDVYRNIWVTSFTNEACDALSNKIGNYPDSKVLVQGMHKFGRRILVERFPRVRFGKADTFKYSNLAGKIFKLDWRKAEEKEIIDNVTELCEYARTSMLKAESLTMADLQNLAIQYSLTFPTNAEMVSMVAKLMKAGADDITKGSHDFIDMLWGWSVISGCEVPKFALVIVDESQDLNEAQRQLTQAALAKGGKYVAVGDNHQAIYMFAGALSNSMTLSREQLNADVLSLPVCYRCDNAVINCAQTVVPNIEAGPNAGPGAVNHIDTAEMLKQIQEHYHAKQFGQTVAVISRLTAPLVQLCLQLLAKRIPAAVRGRKIGAKLVKTVKAVSKMDGFTYAQLPNFTRAWTEEAAAKLDGKKNAEGMIQTLHDSAAAIIVLFESGKANSVESFCREMEALFTEGTSVVTLMTGHRAKGLEFDTVYVINPDKLPLWWPKQTPEQAEQEMNLLYVVITRARHTLNFVYKNGEAPQGPSPEETSEPAAPEAAAGRIIEVTAEEQLNEVMTPREVIRQNVDTGRFSTRQPKVDTQNMPKENKRAARK